MERTGVPRKPKSAYWIFAGDFFANYQPKSPTEKHGVRKQLCGKAFQALSKEELQKYKQLEQQQIEEYQKATNEINEKSHMQIRQTAHQNEQVIEIQTEKMQINDENDILKNSQKMQETSVPRKPKSAYWIFAGEFFANYKPKSTYEKGGIRKQLCGKAFQALSKEELEKYKKMEQEQREMYEKYKNEIAENSSVQSQESKTEEIQTERKEKKQATEMNRIRTKKREEFERELSQNESVVFMNTQGSIIKKRSEISKPNPQNVSILDKRFPNESEEYREKRKALLQAEIDLKVQTEEVIKMRRDLPKGGKVKANYDFTEMVYSHPVNTEFISLFRQGKNTLIIYSLMFDEDDQKPCSQCSNIIDSWVSSPKHVKDKVNFVVVANINIEKLSEWVEESQWDNIRFLSCVNNQYDQDYFAEDIWGHSKLQMPMLNVFEKDEDGEIYHFWGSEILYVKFQNEENSHVDSIRPLLNIFDISRELLRPQISDK